ncbi:MAG: stage II sporulation protein R [Clostridia bacterium]|nr:stage II sporulation protein R [Clostridia bacterium]
MRKAFIFITLLLLLITAFLPSKTVKAEACIRIHIRANSNGAEDQNLKIAVRDSIVEYLCMLLADCSDKAQAQTIIDDATADIEKIANQTLYFAGADYSAHAVIRREYFERKQYGDSVFREGFYDALIIELGEGKGDNWWCVAFPPLCFINGEYNGTGKLQYKSLFAELWNKLLGR